MEQRVWLYGVDNREAAIRICSPMLDDPAGTVNLEIKPSDSSANPYLALGGVIRPAWTASGVSWTPATR